MSIGTWCVGVGLAVTFYAGFLPDPYPVLSYGFLLMAIGCFFIMESD